MKGNQFITNYIEENIYTDEQVLDVEVEQEQGKMIEANVLNLYPDYRFQIIDGFGASMTESSAYLLSAMNDHTQQQALNEYFGVNGLKTKFLRVHMDSCDYSLSEYQAVENPLEDPDLNTFNIDRDKKYIIPMIKKAMKLSEGELNVILSPWSPPKQWKTNSNKGMNDQLVYGGEIETKTLDEPKRSGGSLKPEYYGKWAKYVVKYIQAYLDEGIPVTMISLQNETIAETNWDSCVWTAEESKIYLRDYLYPELKKAGLESVVGIFIWDHNKERMIEHVEKLIDEETENMISGIAFHWYSGDHFEAIELLHKKYPDKVMMLSECCALHEPEKPYTAKGLELNSIDVVGSTEYVDAVKYAHDMIGNLNAGMSRWIDWNMFVDESGGPRHVARGFTSGLIVDKCGNYKKTLMNHYIGHFSKYISCGAVRIGYSKATEKIEIAAFQNPNKEYVVVLLNKESKDRICYLRINGTITKLEVAAHTISTVVLKEH